MDDNKIEQLNRFIERMRPTFEEYGSTIAGGIEQWCLKWDEELPEEIPVWLANQPSDILLQILPQETASILENESAHYPSDNHWGDFWKEISKAAFAAARPYWPKLVEKNRAWLSSLP